MQRSHDRGDLATVIVRPPWFYGPYQPARQTQFFAAVRRGRFPLVGDGTQRRSMVYTGNLVHGLLRAEVADAAPGRAYWIADAEPYELRDDRRDRARRARGRGPARVGRRRRACPRSSPAWRPSRSTRVAAGPRAATCRPLHVLGELKDTIACDISRARERARLRARRSSLVRRHAGEHPLVPRARATPL